MSSGIAIIARDRSCVLRNNSSYMSGYPWIRTWLKEYKKSQAAFGRAIGLDGPQVTRVLKGERKFTPLEMEKAADFLHCSMKEIASGERNSTHGSHMGTQVNSDIQRESDIAIIYVLKMIFHLLIKHQVVSPKGLDFNFTEALDHYRKQGWAHAAGLMEKFRTFVNEEPHLQEKEAIRRLLELVPAGRA